MDAFEALQSGDPEGQPHVVRLRAMVIPLLDGLIGIASALTLLYGGHLVLNGDISLGKFVAFNSYVMTLVWPMMAAGESITMLSQGIASWRRVKQIFLQRPEVTDDDYTDQSVDALGSSIELKDVHFRYAASLPEVFHGLSAEIPAGATIGILGRTGCGKSTLTNLLTRLYHVEPGQILIGGRDIREIPLAVLREHIAVVPQENLLFSDTLQSNIAFGTRTLDKMPLEKPQRLKIFIRQSEAAEQWVEREMTERESAVDRQWNDYDAVVSAAKAADIHRKYYGFSQAIRHCGRRAGRNAVRRAEAADGYCPGADEECGNSDSG